jgi:thiol-disulfide isomerase/thioredoxin
MDPVKTLNDLVTADVITEADDRASIRLTTTFRENLKTEQKAISTPDDEVFTNVAREITDDEDDAQSLVEDHTDLIASFRALSSFNIDLPPAERILIVVILSQLDRGFAPSSGTPTYFLPVYGDQLEFLFQGCKRAIIYVWRNDCDPCDVMKEEFEMIFANPPDDLVLIGVYGPESAALLEQKYNVVGGPTTLFVFNGQINARLQGSHHRKVIENEIQILKNRAE